MLLASTAEAAANAQAQATTTHPQRSPPQGTQLDQGIATLSPTRQELLHQNGLQQGLLPFTGHPSHVGYPEPAETTPGKVIISPSGGGAFRPVSKEHRGEVTEDATARKKRKVETAEEDTGKNKEVAGEDDSRRETENVTPKLGRTSPEEGRSLRRKYLLSCLLEQGLHVILFLLERAHSRKNRQRYLQNIATKGLQICCPCLWSARCSLSSCHDTRHAIHREETRSCNFAAFEKA